MKKQTQEEFIRKSKAIFGNMYDYTKVEYIKSTANVILICKKHGKFKVQPAAHLCYKRGCLACKGVKHNVASFLELANKIHGDKYSYDLVTEIKNVRKYKVKIACPLHGVFEQLPDKHINAKQGCPKCSKSARRDLQYVIKKANKIHGNKYDYSKAHFTKMFDKIEIICSKHGSFWQIPSNHIHITNKMGCPDCALEDSRIKPDAFIERCKVVHNDKYDYSETKYTIMTKKIEIICPKHGSFFQKASSHLLGKNGCPNCYKCISDKETKWLDLLKIPKNKRNVSIKNGDKKYNVDALVDNIVYEFYGDYWHGNPNVYSHKMINKHNKIPFINLYQQTIKREKELIKLGYDIVSIWESDFQSSNK
ncbi:MAG TPA: DUF723 domain-containing protein [Candidatus Glassbacteria bacterium]|nr:DUF723 domain-containing protein [Candidatus Glassbacteria bacterium]